MVVGGLLALAVLPFFGGWKALAQTQPGTILALAGSGIAGSIT